VKRQIVLVLLAAALLTAGPVRSQEETPPPPPASEETPGVETPAAEPLAPADMLPSGRFVAEVVDSTYFLEPAQFFALDLPVRAQGGALAAHILGDVSVIGARRDLIVRLFRAADYQNWLKRRGGRQAAPIWSSSRQRTIRLDMELPQGTPMVLLLDNGYSLRTPKRVRVQIQLQYQGEPGARNVSSQRQAAPEEGDIVPRSNTEDDVPPPPPPAGSN
jgi:hypothetical protein